MRGESEIIAHEVAAQMFEPVGGEGCGGFPLLIHPGSEGGASAGDDGVGAGQTEMVLGPAGRGDAVGIEEAEIFAFGGGHSLVEDDVFAPAFVGVPQVEDVHLRMVGDILLDPVDGVGVGSVVGDDDLRRCYGLMAEPFEHEAQPLEMVVSGDDDGERREGVTV